MQADYDGQDNEGSKGPKNEGGVAMSSRPRIHGRAILGQAIYWNVPRGEQGRLLHDGGLAEQAMDDVPKGGEAIVASISFSF